VRVYRVPAAVIGTAIVMAMTSCSASTASPGSGPVLAVAAENEYASVLAQVGGRYVRVSAIESNPNTDPHSFEASPSVARTVAAAQLIVQNGIGYDSYMTKIENGSPNSTRKIITVQRLLGLPDSTPNPHLWYSPRTMPAVAKAIAADLAQLRPAHTAYFRSRAAAFDRSLRPWLAALAQFKARYGGTPVAVTEPVADYMLQAAGASIRTPFAFQAEIMNDTDPAPQYVSLQERLFARHQVKVFLYNQQVTDSITASFLAAARRYHIPVVGVYETMPTPGYNYQSWMLAEITALRKAVTAKASTEKL